ncbi:hypothetical protein [Kribbella sp. NPDC006257]|uniref:hypothetical protein n=1 Tax=Kribbella sp. NPDC006257 TaxID=3156738 RepID=UPI00339FB393
MSLVQDRSVRRSRNPLLSRAYEKWPTLGESLIKTASGALLLTTGKLSAYGVPTHPMTEQDEDPVGTDEALRETVTHLKWAV